MELKVAELLGMRDLALRSWAEELFNSLEEMRGKVFTLDFSGIDFMSRSFAHEYLKQKQHFRYTIQEKNLGANVKQMFELASQLPNKKKTQVERPIPIQNL